MGSSVAAVMAYANGPAHAGVDANAVANAEALRVALGRQHRVLASVADQLERATRDRVPSPDETQWRGPARFAYDAALTALRGTLARALVDVFLAQSSTLTALTTLGSRVR